MFSIAGVSEHSWSRPTFSTTQTPLYEPIQKIVREALIELAVSLSIAAAFTFPLGLTVSASPYFTLVLIQSAINTALRVARVFFMHKGYNRVAHGISWEPEVFAYLTAWNSIAFIHELGHAAVANAFFYHPNISIELQPLRFSGITWFINDELSSWGLALGRERTMLLFHLAGPVLALGVGLGLLKLGLAWEKKHPELSNYLITAGVFDFGAHASYALSAHFSPHDLNDFFHIYTATGIHPLALAATLAAIPFFIIHFSQMPSHVGERVRSPEETGLLRRVALVQESPEQST